MEPVVQTTLGTAEDVITGLEFLVDLPRGDPSWISRMKEKNDDNVK